MFRKLLCLLTLLVVAPSSFAHPMGNFSVNHYSKISLERDGVKVTYIIDLAEIPTYQELQQGNVTADVADPSVKRFVESRGHEFARWPHADARAAKRLPLKLALRPESDFSSRRGRSSDHENGLRLPGGVSRRGKNCRSLHCAPSELPRISCGT